MIWMSKMNRDWEFNHSIVKPSPCNKLLFTKWQNLKFAFFWNNIVMWWSCRHHYTGIIISYFIPVWTHKKFRHVCLQLQSLPRSFVKGAILPRNLTCLFWHCLLSFICIPSFLFTIIFRINYACCLLIWMDDTVLCTAGTYMYKKGCHNAYIYHMYKTLKKQKNNHMPFMSDFFSRRLVKS